MSVKSVVPVANAIIAPVLVPPGGREGTVKPIHVIVPLSPGHRIDNVIVCPLPPLPVYCATVEYCVPPFVPVKTMTVIGDPIVVCGVGTVPLATVNVAAFADIVPVPVAVPTQRPEGTELAEPDTELLVSVTGPYSVFQRFPLLQELSDCLHDKSPAYIAAKSDIHLPRQPPALPQSPDVVDGSYSAARISKLNAPPMSLVAPLKKMQWSGADVLPYPFAYSSPNAA